MGLTQEQAEYMRKIEVLRTNLHSAISNCADRLMQARSNLVAGIEEDPEKYAAVFGNGAENPDMEDASIDVELQASDSAIDNLFSAGTIPETREEREARITSGTNPAFPLPV